MMSKDTWRRLYEQQPVKPTKEFDEREQKRQAQRERFDRNRHKMIDMVTDAPIGHPPLSK